MIKKSHFLIKYVHIPRVMLILVVLCAELKPSNVSLHLHL